MSMKVEDTRLFDVGTPKHIEPQKKSTEVEQNAIPQLSARDVPLQATDSSSVGAKPRLAVPPVTMDFDKMVIDLKQILTQLVESKDPDTLQFLMTLGSASSTGIPAHLKNAFIKVIQDLAKTEMSASHSGLLDVLATDDSLQKRLLVVVHNWLSANKLKDDLMGQAEEMGADNKVESEASVKQSDFVGIQTKDMMSFMFNLLRKIMAELNISDRRINAMFATLSANMIEKAAQSTIREGEEAYRSAIIGFATAIAITTVATVVQVRSMVKQNQAVNKHLKPANIDKAQADKLTRNLDKTTTTAKASEVPDSTTPGGNRVKQATAATEAEMANSQNADLQLRNEVELRAKQHKESYDHTRDSTSNQFAVASSVSGLSGTAGQLSSASNAVAGKEAEADKMAQSSASEVAKGIVNDKQKQIELCLQLLKEILQCLTEMHASTVRADQTLVKG